MERITNCEESIGKIVGKRMAMRAGGQNELRLQATLNQLSPRRIPRGVYRFHSHEEAEQWLMHQTLRHPTR